jgi:hypothetical protein
MGFIYSFDMSEEIPYFKRYPEYVQSSAESNAVRVIYESFVVPADQDYLMSRLLAQKGLPRGFYWAAAQAIEKYLKAFLLLNGKSVLKGFNGHPLKKLFEASMGIDISFADLNILPHQNIEVKPDLSHHLKKFGVSEFFDDLEKHGSADNRYNALGVQYNTGYLFAMDSLSFQLRSKINVISINESFRNLSPDLILIFEKNNPWFHEEKNQLLRLIPSEDFPIQYSATNTTFEFLLNNENNLAYKLALQWLRSKMKLPTSQ